MMLNSASRNPAGFAEDFRRDTDFPDIVDGADDPDSFDFIRGKAHLCSDGTSEHGRHAAGVRRYKGPASRRSAPRCG